MSTTQHLADTIHLAAQPQTRSTDLSVMAHLEAITTGRSVLRWVVNQATNRPVMHWVAPNDCVAADRAVRLAA